MLDPRDLYYIQHRHESLRKEAENERLARLARQSQQPTTRPAPRYHAALAELGRHMTALGEQLEARYGEVCRECARAITEGEIAHEQAGTS